MLCSKLLTTIIRPQYVESTHICKAMMSQRQVKKPKKGPVPKIIMHKEIIEEQAQRDYAAELEKEGRLDNEQVQHLLMNHPEKLRNMQVEAENTDMPIPGLTNPYVKPPQKCIICEQNVELDYKNVRLLSQFVSPHTGLIYGRQKTGLCIYMQSRISTLIQRARTFGYMSFKVKKPEYVTDPKLFDPFRGPFKKRQF